MFEIVVERIAASEAFDGAAGKRPEPLGDIVMSRAEYIAKILGQEFAQPLGLDRSDGFHRTLLRPEATVNSRNPSPRADRPNSPLATAPLWRRVSPHHTTGKIYRKMTRLDVTGKRGHRRLRGLPAWRSTAGYFVVSSPTTIIN